MTGFIDAEGCFYIRLAKNKKCKMGWRVKTCFQLGLYIRDKDLLFKLKYFFNDVGNIYINNSNNNIIYQVRTVNEIMGTIIPNFEKYPLITQKQSDFVLFKKIVELMDKDKHLDKDENYSTL